jgi:hypothetical protein
MGESEMKRLKKAWIGALTIYLVISSMPSMPRAEPTPDLAAAQITQTPPEIRSSPEIKIPEAAEKKMETKIGHKWLWALLGLALVGGAAAAAGGGGGGGGGDDGGSSGTGSVTGSW